MLVENSKIPSLPYTDDVVKSFKTCEIVKLHERDINSIDFSDEGNLILTSGKDDLLTIFDIEKKEIIRKLYNKTHGCENAIFTHNSRTILCSSKDDFRIMYWCLHSNEILFSFLGHSDLIIDIMINPLNDLFLSTSNDKTSRLWNLELRTCVCIFQDSNFAAFDDSGKVIASVACDIERNSDKITNYINLYGVEDVLKGPFKVFSIENKICGEMKQIKFSNDGAYLVCSSSDNFLLVLDAYDGNLVVKLCPEVNDNDILLKFDISPDSKYIACGTESGNINLWNIKQGSLLTILECHPKSSNCVKFSPKHTLLATSCTNLVLWHPSIDIAEVNKNI